MGTPQQSMRKVLKDYLAEVESILAKLSALEGEAESYRAILESNNRINSEVEDVQRRIGHLLSKRLDLQQGYNDALFNSDQSKISAIESERDAIDREVSELRATVEDLPSGLRNLDKAAVTAMLVRVHNADLPSLGGRVELNPQIRMANGSYRSATPPTGLLADVQRSNDEFEAEVSAVKTRIREKAKWLPHADRNVLEKEAPDVLRFW